MDYCRACVHRRWGSCTTASRQGQDTPTDLTRLDSTRLFVKQASGLARLRDACLSCLQRAESREYVAAASAARPSGTGSSGTFARGSHPGWGREYALGRLGVLDTLCWRRRGGWKGVSSDVVAQGLDGVHVMICSLYPSTDVCWRSEGLIVGRVTCFRLLILQRMHVGDAAVGRYTSCRFSYSSADACWRSGSVCRSL